MLTLQQLFKASGLNSGGALLANFDVQPLSLASVIESYEQQRQAYFVKLISPTILLSDQVNSFADFNRLCDGPLGQMDQPEVTAFSAYLDSIGLYLRYVSKDLRRAVIFGDVPALVNAPAAPLNDGNFVTIKDNSSGAIKVGTGVIATGTVIVSTVVAAPPAVAAGTEGALILGVAVVALGAGFLIGYGLAELLDKDPPPPNVPSSDNTNVPNETDENDSGDVDVPNAVAVGNGDNGIDVQGMVDTLADGALDEVMSTFPIGWDSGSGTSLPGIGDFGDGSSGGDGGSGGDFGWG
jgi:hypothetical protein